MLTSSEQLYSILSNPEINIESLVKEVEKANPSELNKYKIISLVEPSKIRQIAQDLQHVNKTLQHEYDELRRTNQKDGLGELIANVLGREIERSWSHIKFEGGIIYYNSQEGKALVVYGAIYKKWVELGGVNFCLPITNELSTTDGKGRYNHFSNDVSIYWHPNVGAHSLCGTIRDKWSSLGLESSFLGYPTTDELPTPDGMGRYNHFQNGSIYWSPCTEAHEVHGRIRDVWANLGWENSYLGYPTSDEIDAVYPQGGRVSYFQRGYISWTSDAGVVIMPDSITFSSGTLGPSTTSGFADLAITSSGSWAFKGHMHEAGWFGHNVTFGAAILLPEVGIAFGVMEPGTVRGTFELGPRDHDWDRSGFDERLIKNFDLLKSKSASFTMKVVNVTGWSVVLTSLLPVGIVLAILGGVEFVRNCSQNCYWGTRTNPDGSEFTGLICPCSDEPGSPQGPPEA